MGIGSGGVREGGGLGPQFIQEGARPSLFCILTSALVIAPELRPHL